MSNLIKSNGSCDTLQRLGVDVKPMDLSQQFEKPLEFGMIESQAIDDSAVQDHVENIYAKARMEGDIIIRTAHSEAHSVKDEAYNEGYQDGIRDSMPVIEELVARLQADISNVQEDKAAVLEAIEPDVLKLCIDIVEKVIRHEAKTDSRVVMRMVKSCLRRLRDRDEVTLRVNPDEVETVRAKRDELLKLAEGIKDLSIIDDRRVSHGGCVVESPSGDLDARIETQLDQVYNKLVETYENDRRDTDSELREIQEGDQQA